VRRLFLVGLQEASVLQQRISEVAISVDSEPDGEAAAHLSLVLGISALLSMSQDWGMAQMGRS